MIILASKSPRRKELFKLITDDFITASADIDESFEIEYPEELVCYLAEQKARAVFEDGHQDDIVIGADTVVDIYGQILGKPKDKENAREMIDMLSGSTHAVYTGVALIKDNYTDVCYEKTLVTFDRLSDEEKESYLNSADIYDKAGAYAVQGEAAKYISRIYGCYYNVMGLPVNTIYKMLKRSELG